MISEDNDYYGQVIDLKQQSIGDNQSSGGSDQNVPAFILPTIFSTTPVAISFEVNGSTAAVGAASASPWGGLLILKGQNAFSYHNFSSAGLGVGWLSASASMISTYYYYYGNKVT